MNKKENPAISQVTGRRQALGLRGVTGFTALAAAAALLLPGAVGERAGLVAIGAVIATPLIRVGWLVGRWWQEHDLRFVAVGAALLGVMGVGAALAVILGS